MASDPDAHFAGTPASVMSLGEHLEDLRRRVMYALLSMVPLFIICLAAGTWLMEIILRPLQAQLRAAELPVMLQATGPTETFAAWVKVAVAATIVLGVPLALYQLWLFVAPGLYKHERRFARFLVPLSIGLTALGLLFLYYVLLPVILAFLLRFGAEVGSPRIDVQEPPAGIVLPAFPVLAADPPHPEPGAVWFNSSLQELRMNIATVRPDGTPGPTQIRGAPMTRAAGIAQQFRISQYLTTVFNLSLAVAIGFQMPVAVLLLGWAGIITPELMARNRRYAILLCFVLAAVLTPPDPISLVLLSFPLWLLYEFGLIMLRLLPPQRIAAGILAREPRNAGDE